MKKQSAEEQAKQWAQITRESARETLTTFPTPFVKLSYVREWLGDTINQKGDEIETALKCRALLVEACAELEKALLNLRVIEPKHASGAFLTEQEYQRYEPKV